LNQFYVWDVIFSKPLRSFQLDIDHIYDAQVNAAGTLLVVAGVGDVALYDLSTGQRLQTFDWDGAEAFSVAISADDRYVIAGGRGYGGYALVGRALIWEVGSGTTVREFVGVVSQEVTWVGISPDGAFAAIGEYQGMLRLLGISLDIDIGSPITDINGISGVSFSPDMRYVVTTNPIGNVNVFDPFDRDFTRQTIHRFDLQGSPAISPVFTADGQQLLVGQGNGDLCCSIFIPVIFTLPLMNGRRKCSLGGLPTSRLLRMVIISSSRLTKAHKARKFGCVTRALEH
jgi:WD40 repeat protein